MARSIRKQVPVFAAAFVAAMALAIGTALSVVPASAASPTRSIEKPEAAPPQESPAPAQAQPPAPAPTPPDVPPSQPAQAPPAPAAQEPAAPAPAPAAPAPAAPAPAPRTAPGRESPHVAPPVHERRRLIVEPPPATPQAPPPTRERGSASNPAPRPRTPEPVRTLPNPVTLPVPGTPVQSPHGEPVTAPERVPVRQPGRPVTTPQPGTGPPLVAEPVPIQAGHVFTIPVPRRRPHHAPPMPIFHDPCRRCRWIDVGLLRCGPGRVDQVPSVVLQETTQWSDEEQPAHATYYFGPGLARLQYGNTELIVDVHQQLVARIDAKNGAWQVQDIADWQAYVDSATTATSLALSPRAPKFTDRHMGETMAGFVTSQFTATARKTDDEGTRLLVENEVWATEGMELTRDMYEVYRLALYLFDGRCIDLPAERPDGVILRSRLSWHPIKDSNHDNDLIEDSVIESVRYELVPRTFFEIPGQAYDDMRPLPAATTRAR